MLCSAPMSFDGFCTAMERMYHEAEQETALVYYENEFYIGALFVLFGILSMVWQICFRDAHWLFILGTLLWGAAMIARFLWNSKTSLERYDLLNGESLFQLLSLWFWVILCVLLFVFYPWLHIVRLYAKRASWRPALVLSTIFLCAFTVWLIIAIALVALAVLGVIENY